MTLIHDIVPSSLRRGSRDIGQSASHSEDRIRVLTRLLDHQALAIPISNIDPKNLDLNEELRFYYYLATLLTTGSYGQNCAVTAIMLPGVVKCIIVDTGERRNETGEKAQMRIHRVQERRIDIETLGSCPYVPSDATLRSGSPTSFNFFLELSPTESTSRRMPQIFFMRYVRFTPNCTCTTGRPVRTGTSCVSSYGDATRRLRSVCRMARRFGRSIPLHSWSIGIPLPMRSSRIKSFLSITKSLSQHYHCTV